METTVSTQHHISELRRQLIAAYKKRAAEIVELHNRSWSYAHIAREYGITKQRVAKIIEKAE